MKIAARVSDAATDCAGAASDLLLRALIGLGSIGCHPDGGCGIPLFEIASTPRVRKFGSQAYQSAADETSNRLRVAVAAKKL
jgi:hypothetical protein